MRLATLCGRPLVHGIWGSIAGWIYDVWLDFRAGRVVAFEICEADRLQFKCVEPFTLRRSTRYGLGIDADPESWRLVEREMRWASVRNIEEVAIVSADGDWSCVAIDAQCEPETWRLTNFSIRRRWWEFWEAKRMLWVDELIDGGEDVLMVRRSRGAR